jgi:hypothetical protein
LGWLSTEIDDGTRSERATFELLTMLKKFVLPFKYYLLIKEYSRKEEYKSFFNPMSSTECQWLTILTVWESEIGRIKVLSQLQAKKFLRLHLNRK